MRFEVHAQFRRYETRGKLQSNETYFDVCFLKLDSFLFTKPDDSRFMYNFGRFSLRQVV